MFRPNITEEAWRSLNSYYPSIKMLFFPPVEYTVDIIIITIKQENSIYVVEWNLWMEGGEERSIVVYISIERSSINIKIFCYLK